MSYIVGQVQRWFQRESYVLDGRDFIKRRFIQKGLYAEELCTEGVNTAEWNCLIQADVHFYLKGICLGVFYWVEDGNFNLPER